MSTAPITATIVRDRLAALGPDGAEFLMAREGIVRMRTRGRELVVDRPGVNPITDAELRLALESLPLDRPAKLDGRRLHATSYLFALLRDERIVGPELATGPPPHEIAVIRAQEAQRALAAARSVTAQAQEARDLAVRTARAAGAGVREIAARLELSPEAIARLIEPGEGPLWRVRAECGVPAAGAPALALALAEIGRVNSISSHQPIPGGLGPGPVTVDVRAATARAAIERVESLLSVRFGMAGYPVQADRLPA